MDSLGPHGLAVVVDLLDSIALGSGGIHIVVTDRPQAVGAEVKARCPPGWVPGPLFSPERDRLSEAAYARSSEQGTLLVDVVEPRSEGERAALRALNDYREVLLRRGVSAVVIVGGKDASDADAAYVQLQARAPDFWSVRNRVHRATGPDVARSMTDELLDLLSPKLGGDRTAARRWLDRRPVAEDWVKHRLWREGRERAAWIEAAVPMSGEELATRDELESAFIVPKGPVFLDESPLGEAIAPERWPRPRVWSGRLDAEQQALVRELAAAFARDARVELRILPEDVDPEALTAVVLAWSVLESRYDVVLHLDARSGLEGAIVGCLRAAGDTATFSGLIDAARRLQGALGDVRGLLLITGVSNTELDVVARVLRGRAMVVAARCVPHAAFCVVTSASHRGFATWATAQLREWSGGATMRVVREETVLLDLRLALSDAHHAIWMIDSSWSAWSPASEHLFEATTSRSAAFTLDDTGLPEIASEVAWHGQLDAEDTVAREQLRHVARAMAGESALERMMAEGLRRKNAQEQERALASVEHYRVLAGRQPDVYLPALAMSLGTSSIHQMQAGERWEALASGEEAVRHYRALVKQRPDAFLPALAACLNNLGIVQSALGKREEALASAEEAIVLFQRLFQGEPAAFARDFEISLRTYLQRLTDLGRSPEHDPLARSAAEALQHAQVEPS